MRGERMKARREQLGLTQSELGERLNSDKPIFAQAINRYEQERADPSDDMLRRISIALSVTTDWLLGLTDEPNAYIREDDLAPDEREAVDAYRTGNLARLMELALQAHKRKEQIGFTDKQSANR